MITVCLSSPVKLAFHSFPLFLAWIRVAVPDGDGSSFTTSHLPDASDASASAVTAASRAHPEASTQASMGSPA